MKLIHKLSFVIVFYLFTAQAFAQGPKAPESLADTVEGLIPAVVNISTTQTIKPSDNNPQLKEFPPGHPFEEFNEFFKKFMGPQTKDQKSTSLGSGFIIDPRGFIVTNNHVIEKADEIDVTLVDDSQYVAKVIGRDTKTDLALLKIDAGTDLPYVKFGDSDKARVGDWIIVIGNPFGLGGTVTTGIISARARDINAGPFDDFIQTDAAINRGNSGGPMFDLDGNVIGINTAIYSPNGVGNVGIGFAVPSNMAEPIISQLKTTGNVERGWLGVRIQNVTDEIAENLNLDEAKGALVAEVIKDSPAEKAEIEVGDVIIKFDGHEITTMKKLPRVVAETEINKNVRIEVIRGGKIKALRTQIAKLEEEEEENKSSEKSEETVEISSDNIIGMKLAALNNQLRKEFNIDKEVNGLIVLGFEANSEAASKGIRKGNVLLEANQKKLENINQLKNIVEETKGSGRNSVLFLVNRNGDNLFIAIPIK